MLANYADVCVLHSQDGLKEFYLNYPAAVGKSVYIPIGNYDGIYPIMSSQSHCRILRQIPDDARVLLCAGMLRPYKGYESAIALMDNLPDNYHLVIAGRPHIDSYVKELEFLIHDNANISLIAQELTDKEMAELHTAADCILYPYTRITGSSALSTGLTLSRGAVASDLPYFRETLAAEPQAGILHRPGNPKAMAEAVEEYFKVDPSVRNAAARRIADQLPWDQVILPLVERLRMIHD